MTLHISYPHCPPPGGSMQDYTEEAALRMRRQMDEHHAWWSNQGLQERSALLGVYGQQGPTETFDVLRTEGYFDLWLTASQWYWREQHLDTRLTVEEIRVILLTSL
mgnify:CR=1 FL=1